MNKSSSRTFKITNTFTEQEIVHIKKAIENTSYWRGDEDDNEELYFASKCCENLEIKYNSFQEINKKYLTQQTKQELYDTCVAQKKQIEELKKNKSSTSQDNVLLEKYKKKCIELKKHNDKFYEDNKGFAVEQEELVNQVAHLEKCVKEREDYIEDIENIVRKLDKIMNEQKKTIEDLNLINDGLSEQVEEYEEGLEKVNVLEEEVEKLKDDLRWKENDLYHSNKTKDSNMEWALHQKELKEGLEKENEKLKEQLKKYEVVSQFLDKEELVKSVKKKVVKKEVKSKNNLDEMNDILKKYS